MEMPVLLFTGLLESGKTTLINEVAGEEGFLEPGTTVLVQCEEGENEFSQEFLEKHSIVLIEVESYEQLNREFWEKCEHDYEPAQVIIEYNGMWTMDQLYETDFPEEWYAAGIYSTADASRAELYLNNMRKTFMEQFKISNLIIFNRCDDSTDRVKLRRIVKALNPQVDVAFERTDGTMYTNQDEVMPFNYNEDTVEIDDMDYGLWYLDAMEHPDRYLGKSIVFTAKFCASEKPGEKYFVPGRHIMTCCEDDIQFLGFICHFEGEMNFQHGDWIKVTVKFYYGESEMYEDEGPILTLENIEACEQPKNELVTFS